MPSSTPPPSASSTKPLDLVSRFSSPDVDLQLKSLREVKNQIIGNRTKKLSYIKLGAVPAVSSVLSRASSFGCDSSRGSNLVIQSAVALGSFACGLNAGVQAVIDAGALPHLWRLVSSSDGKVVDSGARSLKLIYQSPLAPKYDFLDDGNRKSLLTLLNSKHEIVMGLGCGIITHSCRTSAEQKALCNAGVLNKLIDLFDGSVSQRDASLESLTTLLKNNCDITAKFVEFDSGRALDLIIKFTLDKNLKTRLLACCCLIMIRNVSSSYLHGMDIERKLMSYLLELLEDVGQVGDDAVFALSSLVAGKEDLQKVAFETGAIDEVCRHLRRGVSFSQRYRGLLIALTNICAKLEICRSRLFSSQSQALNSVRDALSHDCNDVKTAACDCLRSLSRSVKNLSAGYFMNESFIGPLLELFHDPSLPVQLAALRAISNMVVDFTQHKSYFLQAGGIKLLVQLSMSMDSDVRTHSVWALKNYMFLADCKFKEAVFNELSASSLVSLICDPEISVREQALRFVRNIMDGNAQSYDYILSENGVIPEAIGRQLRHASETEHNIQGLYALGNIASGSESHKDVVMQQILQNAGSSDEPFITEVLRSDDSRLRTAMLWVIINLTYPSSGAPGRAMKLCAAGVFSRLKCLVSDPCLDVKLRAKAALGQCMNMGEGQVEAIGFIIK
ncbi:hypothetical protein MLD38_040277 [Melastoma candidum]|uniref:Uncharacterized protein n=1 Tax=Melastoma candidum TaxID=119954 RepID=A0ACB9L577_9MYRT|nr:hypothetical protein MLD38_040277 [Melastoma candidum]